MRASISSPLKRHSCGLWVDCKLAGKTTVSLHFSNGMAIILNDLYNTKGYNLRNTSLMRHPSQNGKPIFIFFRPKIKKNLCLGYPDRCEICW